MGISEEELAETAQLAASVAAGTVSSLARRASARSAPGGDEVIMSDYL